MHSDYYETLIHKHLSGELSATEQHDLETWLETAAQNRRQLEEAERIWTLTASAGSELDIDLDHEITRFKQRIQQPERKTRIIPLFSNTILRYAAAAVVLMGGIVLLLQYGGIGADEPKNIVIETAESEIREITLPDQSTVWLNENSRLAYNDGFEKRDLELNGEAFFEVTHDANNPFDIESGLGHIQVLGTSFSVRNRSDEDQISVTVATGKVALGKSDTNEREVLEAGFQGLLGKSDNVLSHQPNRDPEFLAWRTRPLIFDNTSFEDVVAMLRQHFAIVIDTPDDALATCTFTGQFDTPAWEEVVTSLSFSLNVNATMNQGVYAFTGTGCSQ
ncbi:MAG: FecR domain-containing protein [Rhodothermales bacterium]